MNNLLKVLSLVLCLLLLFMPACEAFAEEEEETVLRPMRIAKRCGCKFYCGSDVHKPERFAGVIARFECAVDLLGLTEEDKFLPAR